MKFRPLPPGLAQRMIAGIADELGPLAESRVARIKAQACPRCHSSMSPQIYTPQVFSSNDPLPRMMAHCQECQATIDPVSGIVLSTGNGSLVKDDPMIIKPQR